MIVHLNQFNLSNKVAVVTGAAGLLGRQHCLALAASGATVAVTDLEVERANAVAVIIQETGANAIALRMDVTDEVSITAARDTLINRFGRVDILVNNAAIDSKVKGDSVVESSRLEVFSLDRWNLEVAVGLTGAFLASRVFGTTMASSEGGVILNIASDLAVIAPDQRLYRKDGVPDDQQPVKPVTYSVVKTGLIGLTRYLASYWANHNVRVNALSPGGVFTDQNEAFVQRLANLIPMGRMAKEDEYREAVQFLCSDASRYMTGQNMVIDGGRSIL